MAISDHANQDPFNEDVPGAMERALDANGSIQAMAKMVRRSLALHAISPAAAEVLLIGYLCTAGEPHVHYIDHCVDEVEYTHIAFGYQN